MKLIQQNPWLRMLMILALLTSCLLITGCNGCRNNLDEDEIAKREREEKEKEKKKPDFETRTPVLLPGLFPKEKKDRDAVAEADVEAVSDPFNEAIAGLGDPVIRSNRVKLGHWVTANFQIIANNYNADGQLSTNSMNAIGRPVPIPSTDYYLTTTRPASLPKGEWKNLETTVFLPRRDAETSFASVNYSLERTTGGLSQISQTEPTALLKSFQQHILLLSNRPDSYKYMTLTDTVRLHGQQMGDGEIVPPFYYIVPTVPGDPIPLPRHALNWTTIAYLVWDDYDPESLSQEHQEAILDWIHFGGQLILSGPDCLDKLQNSFLAKYLPAEFDGSHNLTNKDLVELNENWTVPVIKNEAEKRIFQISETVPLLGVTFKPHVNAQFVNGTGELAIERRVGRGRIVATAFSLNAPIVVKWRSFSSFLNNALLRRPSRRFGNSEDMDITFGWEFDRTSIFDPLMGTTLRFLSRDLARDDATPTPAIEPEQGVPTARDFITENSEPTLEQQFQLEREKTVPVRNETDVLHFGGYADAPQSGTCGWNDDSGVSAAARETLKEAAGITPPSSGFVLKMLAVYLAVLVPLNWLVFRLMGRVEWAWAAAPIIAIVGALLVVRMASLDIGFVRSNTQIGLLEIHADYPRAHATEYSALYTSLSTRYDVDLDNPTAQTLPFARVGANQFYQESETLSQVKLRRTVQNRLEGFQIQSNSTGLLHSEFMLDLEGTISSSFDAKGKPETVSNGSMLDLSNVGVIWRDANSIVQIAWIGDLSAHSSSSDLKFEATTDTQFAEKWRAVSVFSSSLRSADDIWNIHFGERPDAELAELAEIPELKSNWNTYQQLFVQLHAVTDMAPNSNKPKFSREDFRTIFRSINTQAGVRIGRVFDAIADNLQLAPGECRLIGNTSQRLGRTQFEPEATQTDQQTLVVVHLKQPPFPLAKHDVNSMVDFKVKSNLDWDEEMKQLENELDE